MNLYNKDLLPLSDFSYWESKKLYTQLMEKFINEIFVLRFLCNINQLTN